MTKDSSSYTANKDLLTRDKRQPGVEPAAVRPEQLAAAARVMAHVMSRPARTAARMSPPSPLGNATAPPGSIKA